MNGDDGAARVISARQQHRRLDLLEQFRKGFQLADDIAVDVFTLARQLEQRVEVRGNGGDATLIGQRLLEPLALLHQLLALLRLRPKIRPGDFLL